MEKIIFGFSRPRTWKPFAWVIMAGYNIPYSHSYIKIYSEKYTRYLIYQASGTLVNFMNNETFNEHANIIREVEVLVTDEQRTKIMQFAIDNCGKPYGIKEIFGMVWVRLNYFVGRTVSNPVSNDNKSMICSELTAIVLRDCLNISLPKDPDEMSPEDIYKLLTISKVEN